MEAGVVVELGVEGNAELIVLTGGDDAAIEARARLFTEAIARWEAQQ